MTVSEMKRLMFENQRPPTIVEQALYEAAREHGYGKRVYTPDLPGYGKAKAA